MSTSSKFLKSAAIFSMLGLTLAACGDNGAENGGENGETITLGYVDGWTDGQSSTLLWQVILEEQGYDVEIMDLTDTAPLFQGLADSTVDVFPSAWLPETQSNYMQEYEEDVENLGAYYEGAVITLTVPEYTDVNSIEDLPDHAEQLNGEIIGIEPGAEIMDTMVTTVMPEYGLDQGFDLVEASTSAMVATLDEALDAEEDIVVLLWRPFWVHDGERALQDLEDPEGLLGEEETLNIVANADFSADHPDIASWMSDLELSDDEYAELENLVVNEHDGDIAGAEEWVENNRELVDDLTN